MIFSSVFISWIYAVPAHWVWGPGGWLAKMGYVDFAGTSTVHLVGGLTGLILTIILKPRGGRFDPNR